MLYSLPQKIHSSDLNSLKGPGAGNKQGQRKERKQQATQKKTNKHLFFSQTTLGGQFSAAQQLCNVQQILPLWIYGVQKTAIIRSENDESSPEITVSTQKVQWKTNKNDYILCDRRCRLTEHEQLFPQGDICHKWDIDGGQEQAARARWVQGRLHRSGDCRRKEGWFYTLSRPHRLFPGMSNLAMSVLPQDDIAPPIVPEVLCG